MSAAAIVVAAGSGERLGAGLPKAFVPLHGRPLLLRAIEALAATGRFARLVAVVPVDLQDDAAALLERSGAETVAGGATRQASVAAGVARCSERIVAVHDAARPLLAPDLAARVLDALDEDWDAAAPALAVVDTVKRIDPDDGRVLQTVSRTTLRAVQTPQAFRRDLLLRLHGEAHGADATDDLLLVEQAGGRVRLIPGDERNFKITTRADLERAEALLARETA
jgi:2-C-methyl-D-erythritol 4-phosphate cytidylyltransferase